MAFTFPASPTTGQRFTPVGGPTYVWTGTTWDATGAAVNASTFAAKTGWTANQVLFANASGTLAQSSKLGWTDTTGTLTIDGITAGRGGGAIATNTTFGAGALAANTAGTNNVAVGDNALVANTAGYNTAVGSGALASNTNGAANTALGYNAGNANTSSNFNTFLGNLAGSTSTGLGNICVGHASGTNLTNGIANLYVGTNTAASSGGVANELVIATGSATGKGSNTGFITPNGGAVYQGNNSASWAVVSDARIKENVASLPDALATINALNPVSFNYILTGKKDVSFIAQEYMKVLPDQVGTHAASPEEKELTGSDELYDIKQNLVPYLVKAIQELAAKNDALEARLAKLEGK